MTDPLIRRGSPTALKAKHRTMWALGDYPAVADDVIADARARSWSRPAASEPGDRVLDVAAGSGNAAIPAARAGARRRRERPHAGAAGGRRRCRAARVEPRPGEEADAEALPFADGDFDVVLSCVGVMFAPHHQQAADELVRVCRPGGTIGLLSWTPAGFIGQLFATMKPYVAAAAARRASRRRCGGARSTCAPCSATASPTSRRERRTLRVDRVRPPPRSSGTTSRRNYGPTIAAYRGIADDPERVGRARRRPGRAGPPPRPRRRGDGVGVPAPRRRPASASLRSHDGETRFS